MRKKKAFQLVFKNQSIHNMKVVFLICTHIMRLTIIYICIMIIVYKIFPSTFSYLSLTKLM